MYFTSYQKKIKCQQAMNLLKIIAHQTWGADQSTLVCIIQNINLQ